MPGRVTQLANGEYYHLYNRGNSKQIIFHDVQDHDYFEALLSVMNTPKRTQMRDKKQTIDMSISICLVSIGAYCLMPNHFHVLIKQEIDEGAKIFMHKVSTAYVMYYNKKYKHTGSLFEGRFKAKHVIDDRYLKYLFAYIHMNPLKIFDQNWKTKAKSKHVSATMLAYLSHYQHSSFKEYISNKFSIINKNAFPNYFPTKKLTIKSITTWFVDDSFL